jgi:hypothetical protein
MSDKKPKKAAATKDAKKASKKPAASAPVTAQTPMPVAAASPDFEAGLLFSKYGLIN